MDRCWLHEFIRGRITLGTSGLGADVAVGHHTLFKLLDPKAAAFHDLFIKRDRQGPLRQFN